jgi:hypothetical protein
MNPLREWIWLRASPARGVTMARVTPVPPPQVMNASLLAGPAIPLSPSPMPAAGRTSPTEPDLAAAGTSAEIGAESLWPLEAEPC